MTPEQRTRKHARDYESYRRRTKKYGITLAHRESLLADQGGRCAACRTDRPGRLTWRVDYCQGATQPRGILCIKCKTVLSFVNSDPALLKRMASYLEGNP